MGILRRKTRSHLIPIHPHNVGSKDWLILLEARTTRRPTSVPHFRKYVHSRQIAAAAIRSRLCARSPFLGGLLPLPRRRVFGAVAGHWLSRPRRPGQQTADVIQQRSKMRFDPVRPQSQRSDQDSVPQERLHRHVDGHHRQLRRQLSGQLQRSPSLPARSR